MNNVSKETEGKNFFSEPNDFTKDCCEINFRPCELCKTTRMCNTDINRDLSRLLRVRVNLRNCCIGKEISVACLIFDSNNNNILAYKTKTFIVSKHGTLISKDTAEELKNDCSSNCCGSSCTDVEKLFTFVLPVSDICSPLTVRAKIIANYTSIQCN